MQEKPSPLVKLLPLGVLLAGLGIWMLLSSMRLYPESAFPSLGSVGKAFGQEIRSGRLLDDLTFSLWRVMLGFVIAVVLGVPVGIWLGHSPLLRAAFLPAVNFFRNLSPLAWISFAVLWFHIGDNPVVFLIFLSVFFPIVLAVCAAVASIPAVHFQVAREYGLGGLQLLTQVTLPAIMPQVITTLRMAAGMAWVVVVAGEMLAGDKGLGWAIWDARNGLRTDLMVCEMIVIGVIGVVLDQVLVQLTRLPSVRWGYER